MQDKRQHIHIPRKNSKILEEFWTPILGRKKKLFNGFFFMKYYYYYYYYLIVREWEFKS